MAELVRCPKCDMSLTKRGLSRHIGSRKCKHREQVKNCVQQAEAKAKVLEDKGKVPVPKYVTNALERRQAHEVAGIEHVETGVVDAGSCVYIVCQHWVYEWVSKAYHYHHKKRNSNVFYADFKKLASMNEKEREKYIGLIMLEVS